MPIYGGLMKIFANLKSTLILSTIIISSISCAKTEAEKLNPAQRNANLHKNEINDLLNYEKNNVEIFKNVAPSVVNVSNIKIMRNFWDMETNEIPAGQGTGWVWNDSGYIVTNYHVVRGGDSFRISFHKDTKEYEAKIVGSEPRKDIAVLKLIKPPKNLRAVNVGSSKDLMVGQKAIAIGNPFGFDHTMTVGVVSATGRKIEGITGLKIHNMIQTDAAINPGNSGGPLLNSKGDVIGMNTQIVSGSGSSAGVGFSVPIDSIKRIVPQIIEHGKVIRPGLGIIPLEDHYAKYFGVKEGLVIRSVDPKGGAAKAGLKGMERDRRGRYFLGDIILSIDGKKINSLDDIFHILDSYKSGDTVEIKYDSEGKVKTTEVKLQTVN